ncbi:hypothetical protein JHK87_056016 [Glycine soja]|nr:hypothetical protein JHK87_056016 [Glycine soja]
MPNKSLHLWGCKIILVTRCLGWARTKPWKFVTEYTPARNPCCRDLASTEILLLDCISVNFYWMLLCGRISSCNQRAQVDVHGMVHARISWDYWLKRILYYHVGPVYVLTRLVLNVSQAYLAFFVINDLQMAQSAKALVVEITDNRLIT